ncbi:thiol:disulfide interchange protein DsbA/DsbL [Pseudomonas sp. MYb185]|uniref:thiol:disulfide interchange protein DsbA/DsbL n=1 Tax=Pseudomonas sp. MYb185 TaxID=1848729 RepID=UPI0013047CF4|nr:thiol:disulfide interchange protein DsbA/DsbL [Pseudomonas sp. MYb185]
MRTLLTIGLVWLLGSLSLVQAQTSQYQAGVHYVELPSAAPTQEPGKIEVAELFSYGCGHCFTFEPIIGQWKQGLADDAYFRPVPAFFGGAWDTLGQLFYTLESMDKLDETHAAVFQAIHNQGQRLTDVSAMTKLLGQYGIDEDEFRKTWDSAGVTLKINQAKRLTRAYRATGVPTLIVNGKYRIEGSMAGSFEEMLKIADYLVEQERP